MESFWNKNKEDYQHFEKVKDNINVSVCIIGGGITGLSCGYYLSPKMSVAIVERDEICSHTSGKTTGKITSQHGLFYNYLINSEGEEFALKYLEANEKAIENIKKIIDKENIQCDFNKEDAYVFTQNQDDVGKIKIENDVINNVLNKKSEFVDKIELPLNNIKGALKFTNQAQFNPVKYAYGLCECIIKNGGKIYENSKATNIEKENGKYVVYVNNNKILADNVIIATRYPFISFPGYYFLKMYQSTSFAVVADVKEKLFSGMYISSETPTISFRVINEKDKQLLLVVGYDYKTGTDELENGYKELEKIIKQMYPQSQILYKWTAEDCISLDKVPYIGEFSSVMPHVYIATGFNKWGITSSNIAANIITSKILGEDNKYEEIFKAKRLEPIKNIQEVGNMLKEVNESLILSNFTLPDETINDVKNGCGKIVEFNNHKIGVYKDNNGNVYQVKPKCTHLGCELYFNNIEKVWECPCHGSKFSYDGKVLETPANKELQRYKL